MRDDDDEAKPNPDSDRAAILARRSKFIAFALSGLTTTAACTDGKDAGSKQGQEQKQPDKEPPPQPCLNVVAVPPEQPEAPPQPCLEIAPPPEPQACLSVAPPRDPPPEVPPHVCLKVAPRPEEAKPRP
jgi:hypothetical protein